MTFIRKKISLDYSGTDMKTVSDEKWLSFVLEQVLSNALKYTAGSGKISIYVDEAQPQVLVVEDTGSAYRRRICREYLKKDIPAITDITTKSQPA